MRKNTEGHITAKQQEILEYIKQQILAKGYPPAVREICEAVNLRSTSSVHSHLETLEKNGFKGKSAELTRIAENTVEVTDEKIATNILRLMSRLEEHDDVQNVYSNFDISDELMEKIDV